jgi:hypothetical protein
MTPTFKPSDRFAPEVSDLKASAHLKARLDALLVEIRQLHEQMRLRKADGSRFLPLPLRAAAR